MKILFVGDIHKNTGPSNVNRAYYKYLRHRMTFLYQRSKPLLFFELVAGIFKSSAIVVSGAGFSGYLAVKMAGLLKKPTAYLMHGCYEYECEVNRLALDQQAVSIEKTIMAKANRIICVSERFSQWVGRRYPEYIEKLAFVNTGVEWEKQARIEKMTIPRNSMRIVTMGGGRPQKNNLIISRAVEMLNNDYGQGFQLLVLGRDGPDTEAMKQNPHTMVIGQVDSGRVRQYLMGCKIFIQNSVLESFGIGVVEALRDGCDILVSQNVGTLSVITNMKDQDIINDCMDVNEVAEKILHLSRHGNNERLLNSIDKDATSMKMSAGRLYDMVAGLSF